MSAAGPRFRIKISPHAAATAPPGTFLPGFNTAYAKNESTGSIHGLVRLLMEADVLCHLGIIWLPGDYHNTTEPPHGRANVCDTPPRAHSRRVSTESKSCVMAMPPRRFVGRGI